LITNENMSRGKDVEGVTLSRNFTELNFTLGSGCIRYLCSSVDFSSRKSKIRWFGGLPLALKATQKDFRAGKETI
jgi:hypothetical protein